MSNPTTRTELSDSPHAACWIVAGALTGIGFSIADVVARIGMGGPGTAGWSWSSHIVATLASFASVGVLAGLAGFLLDRAGLSIRRAEVFIGYSGRFGGAVAAFATSLLAIAWVWTAGIGPPSDAVSIISTALAAVLAPAMMIFAFVVWSRRNRPRVRMASAMLMLGTGLVCAWLDMTILTGLYPFLHALAELLTAAVWFGSMLLLLEQPLNLKCRWTIRTAPVLVIAALGFLLAGGVVWSESRLRHTANQQGYVGRLLARSHRLALSAVTVTHRPLYGPPPSAGMRRDARSNPGCPSNWFPVEGTLPANPLRAAVPMAPNIAVFYVDTLRQDVASDPRVMPHLVRFSRGALNFTRTYATGSDTRSSLPAMIRGHYDLSLDDEHNALRVAHANGLKTAIAIGASPRAFLKKHLASFAFEEELEAPDANADRSVWGYGAHRPTATRLVDDSIAWLAQPDRKRFLLWQFHYDLHGWKELDLREVERRARMHGIPRYRSEEHWRYRTIAASIDAEFGRFLRALDSEGLADNTVVMFLADHGEGLGYQGFWLHSVFLTENLVRVPLMVRVPGLAGRRIDSPTSVIDVAPTLVRLAAPGSSLLPYHGEDLLTRLDADRLERRFPILMRGTDKEDVVRLGIIDGDGKRKLVLPVGGQPELYDLTARVADDNDIGVTEPETLDRLMSIVVDGPLNPQTQRVHARCQRLFMPKPLEAPFAAQSRRISASRRSLPGAS